MIKQCVICWGGFEARTNALYCLKCRPAVYLEFKRESAAKPKSIKRKKRWRTTHRKEKAIYSKEYRRKRASYLHQKRLERYQRDQIAARAYSKQWYWNNREEALLNSKNWRLKNKEKKLKADRDYRAANLERLIEYDRQRNKLSHRKLAQHRRWLFGPVNPKGELQWLRKESVLLRTSIRKMEQLVTLRTSERRC